ncbi:MAG: DNA repair protein RadC [Candidatus Desulfofervidaceae bacterium]|nr:DNA repair protein RadC [Candidatus Desulfofervidaceae bacterium]
MKHYKIPTWPEEERPREKLLKLGARHLSDAELLAILIGKGTKEKTAVDLARELLIKFGTIDDLASRSPEEYNSLKGIGTAKAVTLAAAFELGQRLQSQKNARKRFKNPDEVAAVYLPLMRHLKKEVFKVLLLNNVNQLIKEVTVSEGILTASLVHPREVFRQAIIETARGIILMHNHPSGNPKPSKEDIEITRQLVQAGEIVGIPVLDHIILGDDTFFSFAQKEMLK